MWGVHVRGGAPALVIREVCGGGDWERCAGGALSCQPPRAFWCRARPLLKPGGRRGIGGNVDATVKRAVRGDGWRAAELDPPGSPRCGGSSAIHPVSPGRWPARDREPAGLPQTNRRGRRRRGALRPLGSESGARARFRGLLGTSAKGAACQSCTPDVGPGPGSPRERRERSKRRWVRGDAGDAGLTAVGALPCGGGVLVCCIMRGRAAPPLRRRACPPIRSNATGTRGGARRRPRRQAQRP